MSGSLVLSLLVLVLMWGNSFGAVTPKQALPEESQPITVKADSVSYDRATNLVTARGNVELIRGSVRLKAEQVSYNSKTQIAEAWGKVVLSREQDVLTTEHLTVNMSTQTGLVEEAQLFIKKDNYLITARRIEKTGPNTYRIEDATFTTCQCGPAPPSWKIGARKLDITLGGFARLRHAVFYLRDIPVLYLPWALFPVITERSTGFLIPSPGFSNREGFKLTVPFFWAISRNMDATFDLDYRSKRGPKLGMEYRYILSEDARGQFFADFLDDRLDKSTRYTIRFSHDQNFSPRFYLRARANFLADETQLAEFEDDIERRAARQLESTGLLVRTGRYANLVNELSFFQDLVEGKESFVPQAVPRITLTSVSRPVSSSPFFYRYDLQFANFTRGRGVTGYRVDLNPVLSLPFKLGRTIELVPEVGWRQTWYFLSGSENTERGMFNLSVQLSTELERIYSLGAGAKLRHSIQPEVIYEWLPPVDQGKLPFFDPVDRREQGKSISFFLTNRLFYKKLATGEISQLLRFRVGQSLALGDIDFNVPARPFPDLRVELSFTPPRNMRLDIDTRFDPKEGDLRSFNADLSIANELLALRYRFSRGLLEELDASTQFTLFERLTLSYMARYSIRESLFLESSIGVGYLSACRCWRVRLTTTDRTRPDRTDVKFSFELLGLGSSF